jgi:hypothetical protein
MANLSARSAKRSRPGGIRAAPPKPTPKAPHRGKPGIPEGAESATARRTGKSHKAVKPRETNTPRKKSK